jgi:PAS domain S-box-containing protein
LGATVTDHVLDTTTDAVITTDAQGFVQEVNRAALRLLGLERDDVVGRPFADLLAAPRSEDARRRALLRAAEELAQVGRWDWLPEQGALEWSPNLYRIFGLTPGEQAPTPEYVLSRTHPDDRARVQREVAALQTTGALHPLEYRITHPDGGLRHLHATLAIAETRDNRPYRLVGWVQDVTDRRRAERRLAAHEAIARALDEWRDLATGGPLLLARLAEAMDYSAGTLWVPDGDLLVARTTWRSALADPSELPAGGDERLAPGVGLAGRAWERGEPLTGDGPGGALAIPARDGDEVVAVVDLRAATDPDHSRRLLRSLAGIGAELGRFLGHRRGELEPAVLTAREREILQLAAAGHSAPRTAEALVISPATVRTHFENIYNKLGVSDKAAAVAEGLRRGLIE